MKCDTQSYATVASRTCIFNTSELIDQLSETKIIDITQKKCVEINFGLIFKLNINVFRNLPNSLRIITLTHILRRILEATVASF